MRQDEFPGIIQGLLARRQPMVIEPKGGRYREAAVLIPLLKDGNEYKVLMTKRTERVEEHKGQISFPGGGIEPGDRSFKETALRETYEEVGIHPRDVTILGRMDDILTLSSNFVIHPVVGRVPYPYDFSINPLEVERILLVPLSVFLPGGSRGPETERISWGGKIYETPVYRYDGEIIWGATARLMHGFVEMLGEKIGLLAEDQ
ncbi:MAG: CoA pyrophosphatase [Deltaproteobacteria bacterium]|nr:CoA pyrophosphatase [Deltaproteobacteria bacterium]MBW2017188.1 CoA pyrophosphatase [Deltaproteobacteria bacterium]MBW2129260.1 CoA pyrophosphatase [Deltaproteobacteria bacterium]MBW2303962.1 CoA pyrophosphatase [Deltaproteobacteria bacterium]